MFFQQLKSKSESDLAAKHTAFAQQAKNNGENLKMVNDVEGCKRGFEGMKGKQTFGINMAFIIGSIAILGFLFRAPEETTPRLPINQNHSQFQSIGSKKEAEGYCRDCHAPGKQYPLPQKHPPEYRCLFCHKKSD